MMMTRTPKASIICETQTSGSACATATRHERQRPARSTDSCSLRKGDDIVTIWSGVYLRCHDY